MTTYGTRGDDLKILIIDDSHVMRNMIQRVVTAAGISAEFIEAGDGCEGLAAIDDSVDLILCDWDMPEMNGIDCIRAYRTDGGELPVIMVTTESHSSKVREAMNAGASGFISKPFTPDQFLAEFRRVCPDRTVG